MYTGLGATSGSMTTFRVEFGLERSGQGHGRVGNKPQVGGGEG